MAVKSTEKRDAVDVFAPIIAQTWKIGQPVDFVIPSNTFVDRQNEALTYTATLSNGEPLPAWLSFNPSTGTFTGTVPSTAAALSIKVTAIDTSGLSAFETFRVSMPASPPKVTDATATQVWRLGQAVNFTLPGDTFTDAQREALTYKATLANGAPLPSWLKFNATSQTFTGTVPNSATDLTIRITATDTSGLSTTETFSVQTPASAPQLVNQTSSQTWASGQTVNLAIAPGTFVDPQGETLSYKATLSSGAALPAWLTFNAATDSFKGTVPSTFTGASIKLTATDTSGLSASEIFSVTPGAAAPVVAQQISGQTWGLGTTVDFVLPGNTFSDPQQEALTYKATLAGGGALPSWLSFNAATQTFSGAVPNTAAALNIAVTATDTSGLSTSTAFSVSTPAAAPVLTTQTASQSWALGQTVDFSLAANTFVDPQQELLSYSAKLANGSALPSWLTFDAKTETFTGVVPNSATGLNLVVTATDTSGLSTSTAFSVSTPAAAPVLATQTATQSWALGQTVDFSLAANTFIDPQQELLSYSAKLANGSALPSWLSFDAKTETFTGVVPNTAAGLNLVVTATDTSGLSASETFAVTTPASAPIVTDRTSQQAWYQGETIAFTLASNTFTDPQQEGLTYSATLGNGNALPSWLAFNSATETFTGTVPVESSGLSIAVTATDTSGLSAQDVFSVDASSAAPILASQTPSQTWNAGQSVNFTLPADTFVDPQNETLTYTATLAGGAQLPSWLAFNGATGTFTGSIPESTSGLNIEVTAKDTSGLSASESFSVATPTTAPSGNPNPTPMRASDLLSTLGVVTHVAYTDSTYANVANVAADLQYLGISQVRDFLWDGSYGGAPLSSYISLAEQGIKFTVFVEASSTAGLSYQLGLIDQVNEAVPGSIAAVEGPNEINNQPITFNGVGGLQGAINLQQALYAAVHADPNLAGVPVDYFTGYDVMGTGPNPATTPGLADSDTAHVYPSNGQAPAWFANPANVLSNEGSVYGPVVYTEAGYSTNGGTAGAVNQDVQAKYTLDLLMDAAKDGASKTYLYQLMDGYQPGSPQGDDGFGLFDPNNVPKEAATAIHNLTTILADNGATAGNFTTTPLTYSVAGLPSTGNDMVMQKSNGAYDIVVWNEPQLWNKSTGTEIAGSTVNVNVQLGKTYSDVEVFDPLLSSGPIQTLSQVNSVQLGITDHPLIIEIEPAPDVAAQTADQTWTAGQSINFALAGNTFSDPGQENLSYSATLSSGGALPSWLAFNGATETFTGLAPNSPTGLGVSVTATNTSGLSTTESFSITVAAAQMSHAIAGSQSSSGGASVTATQSTQSQNTSLASPLS